MERVDGEGTLLYAEVGEAMGCGRANETEQERRVLTKRLKVLSGREGCGVRVAQTCSAQKA